ncbi:STAS domain-containing protein [Spartinivicinus ruber]|uniref:STAS domain-containing protein n=1 Tax=Spartinivicinus ruber TaxID=2683272 RepID=UPI0013D07CD3|nr:STAS domain-containing protein [Spartinivicinus ruber]
MAFNIKHKVSGKTTYIYLSGSLVTGGRMSLSKVIKGIVANNPNNVELDISEVQFIDSMGIGDLLVTKTLLMKNGGKLVLVNPSQGCDEILKRIALDNMIEIRRVESIN